MSTTPKQESVERDPHSAKPTAARPAVSPQGGQPFQSTQGTQGVDTAQPVRKTGVDIEAATTRVAGTPGRDALLNALHDLEQRTADRLGDDHKKGSKAEFESFRQQVHSIVGEPE